jgi:hypothetical protein
MKEREKIIATGLTLLMVILWLGFVFHRSGRFAGTAIGGVFAVSGAMLMLFPLAYMIIKRIKRLKKWVTKFVSMRTLLSWHIYAGILGPILVLLHTGHKFNSLLGIVLTTLTIVVVISGFVGRYLMQQFSTEIRQKKTMLAQLEAAYQREATVLQRHPERIEILRPFTGFFSRLFGSLFVRETNTQLENGQTYLETNPSAAIRISESIADVEYALRTHEKFKAWFGKWLKFHITLSMILYVLLALHVYFAIYFGLRWFE